MTVFVGYTNPFWQANPSATPPPFGQAVELFSFADYEANFGGFFSWGTVLPDYVGQAVFQFFMNGGSSAYVVALQAINYFDTTASPPTKTKANPVAAAQAPVLKSGKGFTFTALKPVGVSGTSSMGLPMSLTISNLTTGVAPGDPTPVTHDTADLTIVYGTTVETYRRVLIGDLITTVNARSALVSVAATGTTPASYDAPLAACGGAGTVTIADSLTYAAVDDVVLTGPLLLRAAADVRPVVRLSPPATAGDPPVTWVFTGGAGKRRRGYAAETSRSTRRSAAPTLTNSRTSSLRPSVTPGSSSPTPALACFRIRSARMRESSTTSSSRASSRKRSRLSKPATNTNDSSAVTSCGKT